MKFDLPKREHPNLEKYHKHDVDMAYRFSNEIYKELSSLVKAVVLFGSSARKTETPKSDIDVLVIVDDITMPMTPEVTEAYRVIVNKIIVKTSTRLHITTLRFTTFWDYMRQGDPIGINILRDGVALIDTGFFDPMQLLLKKGRVRPTTESIWTYYSRAPNTLHNSKWHQLQATIDLYWAVIDAAHAALMAQGVIPPTPEHVADLMRKELVKKGLPKKYVKIMEKFYSLMKQITHRELTEISGAQFDKYFTEADAFVKRMREFIEP